MPAQLLRFKQYGLESPTARALVGLPPERTRAFANFSETSIKAFSGLRRTWRTQLWLLSSGSTLSNFCLSGGEWEDCKQLVEEHFTAMHNMAMEKFFIPQEICNQEPVCGGSPTFPPKPRDSP